jgi:hypothetical protein
LQRLASPREYHGDRELTRSVTEYLNQVLRLDGIELAWTGKSVEIRDVDPTGTTAETRAGPAESPPDFQRVVKDTSLAEILTFHWNEAQRCIEVGAHLSAVIMMGSILEGALLYTAEQNSKTANTATCAPKDKAGTVRLVGDWSLSKLIDVANEVGWIQGDIQRFSHALRESRNIVHPYKEKSTHCPDADTCGICWLVVRAAIEDLLHTGAT